MRRIVPAVVLLTLAAPRLAPGQHEHGAPAGTALSTPAMASGTAWLPAAAPMRAVHAALGSWSLMVHGAASLQYIREFGTREATQAGSINWVMLLATRGVGRGTLNVRAMASAEPFTLSRRGYPELLQVAFTYRGVTVSDRQHPHDLLGEAALAYDHPLGRRARVSLYGAIVGEPALGPVFYSHRPTAELDPIAPLGHHLQDLTHITTGVVTLGASTTRVKVEGSFFNGAHGDDVWTNVDALALNSYAGRLTFNPSPRWSMATWAGHLAAVGGAHAHEAQSRFGASVMNIRSVGSSGRWSTTLVYGAQLPEGAGHPLNSLLVESTLEVDRANALFARAEVVRRTAEDLGLIGSIPDEVDVGAVSGGYARTVATRGRLEAVLAVRAVVRFLPAELELFYGSRTPAGVLAYITLRPAL